MKARLGWLVMVVGAGAVALSADAQGSAKLAVGPDAGGYLCPDGRQLYVKSCYDNYPDAKCGVVNMHLPAQNGFQRESTETRAKLTSSVAACKVYPLEFRDGTVGLVVPKSAAPAQTAKAPAAVPAPTTSTATPAVRAAPKSVAAPAAPPNAASQARQAFLEGSRLSAQAGDDDAALAAFAKAAELDPTLRTAWLRQGQIHYHRFDFDLAIPFYEKALELDSSDVETADQLCIAYVMSDAPADKGVVACERRLKLNPKDAARAHQAITQLQMRKGDNRKALASALEWARLEPRKSLPWATLTEIYVALSRNQEALAAVQQAISIEAKDWDTRAKHGDVLRRLRRFEESVTEYKAAIAIWPEGPELHYGLADTLRAAGRKGEADAEQRLAIDHALSNGRNALKKPRDGSPVSFGSILGAKEYLELLEKWDKAAAAKLAAEIKAAEQ